MRREFEDSLHRALKGSASRADLLELASAGGDELWALLRAALSLRLSAGRTVTLSRNVFVPLTRMCVNRCAYCGFRRDPGAPGAGYIEPEEAVRVAAAGETSGATEVLVSSGDRPEAAHAEAREWLRSHGYSSTAEYAADLEERILRSTRILLPHTNIGVLTRKEMALLRPLNASMGLMLESSSPRLSGPGMPHCCSPTKAPAVRLRMIREAGILGIPFTTGILVGIGETWEERIDSLLAIAELHAAYGHVQEVIVQPFSPEPGTPMWGSSPPDPLDVAKTIALARLVMGPSVPVQAPPNIAGGWRRLYLLAGADDWGGISSLTPDYVNARHPWPDPGELAREAGELGMILRERLPIYPRYVRGGWLPRELEARVARILDREGYVRGAARRPKALYSGSAQRRRCSPRGSWDRWIRSSRRPWTPPWMGATSPRGSSRGSSPRAARRSPCSWPSRTSSGGGP
ncbi:MAG: 7,8-didemethyl-8-hydroxy-5-deazariboflavin synthase CofG [Conexivisphaera sp.]